MLDCDSVRPNYRAAKCKTVAHATSYIVLRLKGLSQGHWASSYEIQ